jgi:NADH:ubiquinone oxidoreductase subunit 2 (subunit N)
MRAILFLLGGGAAFASHATKATTRAAVNTSPEPFSNVVLSTAEDVATGGLLALAFANPIAAALIALVLLGLTIYGLFAARRVLKRFLGTEPVAPE